MSVRQATTHDIRFRNDIPSVRPGSAQGQSVELGRIVALDDDGRILVETNLRPEPVESLLAIPLDRELILSLIEAEHPVVVSFQQGDPLRPIIVGLLQPPLALRNSETESHAHTEPKEPPLQGSQPFVIEADVDGRRVELKAQDELVLRCGEASVTLRRNGRVIVRGTHVETYSTGVNRIKGGQVRIN